jgi:hypothetical protein
LFIALSPVGGVDLVGSTQLGAGAVRGATPGPNDLSQHSLSIHHELPAAANPRVVVGLARVLYVAQQVIEQDVPSRSRSGVEPLAHQRIGSVPRFAHP